MLISKIIIPSTISPSGAGMSSYRLSCQCSKFIAVSRVSTALGAMGPLDVECGHDFEITSGC
jgi:hypothetical protein